ncbi:hypothetical protein [Halobacillus sp. Marseille-Q1614]|uniref:hypothetical protein n=1 Tax=Halobacillus sp. Marseille-Q1614 TaxID=2709134 RepID=UPI00156F6F74|nr:hypothetical protein [Halobacillus sp. Marseille-Q1614]
MKKAPWIITVILVVFLLVVTQNNQELKKERTEAQQKVQALEKEQENQENRPSDVPSTDTIHEEAGDAAEQFVEAYFEYNGNPIEKDVRPYVTDQLMKDLSFEDTAKDGEYESESIESNVQELDVYYGEYSSSQQTVFMTFTNVLSFNGVPSDAKSILKVDMIEENGEWKADAMEFNQY